MINYSTSISHPTASHTHHQQPPHQQQQVVHVSRLQSALDDADVDQLIQFSTHKLAYHNRHFRQRIYALLLSHQFPHVSSTMMHPHHHDSNNSNDDDEHFPSTLLMMTNNSNNGGDNDGGNDGGCQYHHEYVDQVDKDVIRSLYKFVPDESDRTIKRQQLSHLVNSILSHPIAQYNNDENDENEENDDTKQITTTMTPHYYQGFHELCSVLMLSVGPSMTLELMNRYLIPMRTYLNLHVNNSTLESVLNQLQSIYSILYSVGEKEYAHYLKKCDLDQGHYALSWVLTWYSHVIDDLSVAEKVMDAVIAHGSIFCIYMAVSIVIYRKQEVLYRKRDDDDDTDTDDDDDDDNDDNSDNQSEHEDDQDVSNKKQKQKKRKQVSRPDFAQVFSLLNRIPQEWCYEQYVPPSTQSTNRRMNDNNEQETMTVWEHIIQQALKIKELMQTIPLIGEEELRELEREEMEQERRLRRIQQQRSQSPVALKHGSSSWVMWATVFLTVGVSTGLFLLQQQASNLL